MTKRRFMGLLGAAMLLCLIGGGIYSVSQSDSKVTPENFRQLQKRMQYEEVEAILGAPSEEYYVTFGRYCIWEGGGCTIALQFGEIIRSDTGKPHGLQIGTLVTRFGRTFELDP